MAARISPQIIILGASAVAVSGPADTNENILATINIPAGAMGINGILRVETLWTVTSSVNNKTLNARLGGIGGTAFLNIVLTTSVSFLGVKTIQNRGAANSQVAFTALSGNFGATSAAVTTASIDTSAATTLVITGQKASAGEDLTLERYSVELILP
jgi:hypothetical protein